MNPVGVRRAATSSRTWRTGAARTLTVVVAVAATTACVPSAPSTADWRSTALQSLGDASSEAESVALVLQLQADDRLPGRSAQVAATESEDAVATAEQAMSTLQPPAGSSREDTEVADLISRTAELVREARIALAAGDESAYDGLRTRLRDVSDDITAYREELR